MRRVQQDLSHLPADDRLHEKTGLAGLWEHKETFWVAIVAIGAWAVAAVSLEAQHHPLQKAADAAADVGQAIINKVLPDIDLLQTPRGPWQ